MQCLSLPGPDSDHHIQHPSPRLDPSAACHTASIDWQTPHPNTVTAKIHLAHSAVTHSLGSVTWVTVFITGYLIPNNPGPNVHFRVKKDWGWALWLTAIIVVSPDAEIGGSEFEANLGEVSEILAQKPK